MKKIFLLLLGSTISIVTMAQQIFTSSGTFTVPAGVTSITVEVVGAGGRGGSNGAGGGGGGGYASGAYTVVPGATHAVVIGLSASGTGTSSIASLGISATKGGNGTSKTNPQIIGGGGAGGYGIGGQINRTGGAGGGGYYTYFGGGGGGAAGSTGNGGIGGNSIAFTGVCQTPGGLGGIGGGLPGGNGGKGSGFSDVNCNVTNPATTGANYGGGGGGGNGNGGAASSGSNGFVKITLCNPIGAPTGAAEQSFCNPATVADLVSQGTNIQWYASATGGTALTSTEALVNNTTYYAEQISEPCETIVRLAVVATVNQTSAPLTSSTQTFCIGSTVANLVAGGTAIKWYTTATGGTSLASTTALATGTYYASQTLNTCESVRTAVAVTVNTTAAPTASAQTFCNSVPTVANLVANGTAIKWYAAATGGTALVSTTTLTTGTYYASQTLNTCESTRTSVSVTLNTTGAPLTSSTQTFCIGSTVANLVAGGTAIKWYTAATGGTALVSTIALTTGTYYASQTINACEGSRTAVTVTVNSSVAPTATATQTFCGSTNLSQLVVTGTGIKWYTAATGGTEYPSALLGSIGLVNGSSYFASQTVNGCESQIRTQVTVVINAIPSAPNATAQSLCNTALVSNLLPNGPAFKWYSTAAGGTALVSTATLTAGNYYVSQTANGCESVRTAVAVTLNTTSAPTAVAQSFCGVTRVGDLVATGTGLNWYNQLTGGTALSSVSVITSGSYYVSQTINGCESSRTLVIVTIDPVVVNTTTVAACDTYTWAKNGVVYTASGTYTVVTGCNSEVLELTINTSPVATVTRSGDNLNVNATTGATYQWVKCDSSSTSITGATSPTYLAIAAGSYAVEVTNNGCTVTSTCFDVVTLGVNSIDVANLNLYPNPVTDALTITYTKNISGIQVFDITGRLIKNIITNTSEVSVDMSEMPAAVYIVKVIAENTSSEFRVMKN
jgi:hypothetical protein